MGSSGTWECCEELAHTVEGYMFDTFGLESSKSFLLCGRLGFKNRVFELSSQATYNHNVVYLYYKCIIVLGDGEILSLPPVPKEEETKHPRESSSQNNAELRIW